MHSKSVFKANVFTWFVAALLLISLSGIASAAPLTAAPQGLKAPGDQISYFTGTVNAGETIAQTYQLFGPQINVNVKMQIPAAASTNWVNVSVTDGAGGNAFTGAILDGETLWATMTLKPGINTFTLQNTGATAITYEIWMYSIANAPFNWAGQSDATGTWNSSVRLNFPTSGLYTFTFGADSGRYQFLIDAEYVQKTVETAGNVTFYIPAGNHILQVLQDTTTGADWNLNTSAPGAANDTLPYAKSGGDLGGTDNDFTTEWLPVNLAAAASANFALTLEGDSTDSFDVALYAGNNITPFFTISAIHGGETLWWAADLAAGTTRIELIAINGNINSFTYELNIQARPVAPASWNGVSNDDGNNAQVRFTIATAGLYDFNFGLSTGRYQFLVNTEHIQKTVEADGTVRYYLPAGNHTLTIVQDTASPVTTWSLAIASANTTNDTLPYAKSGGTVGGAGNDFTTEWLPIQLAAGVQANFSLTLDGSLDDGVMAYVYQGTSLIYTSPVVFGGETIWWTANLATGSNRLKLVAQNGNGAPLNYHINVTAVPAPTANWQGTAKGSGGNSIFRTNIATAGLYHVTLDTPVGFAQVQVDGAALNQKLHQLAAGHQAEFDIQLSSGLHSLTIKQDTTYTTTTWGLSLAATVASAEIAHFSGEVDPGVTVQPQLPLPGVNNKTVNFRLEVPANTGSGSIDFIITDGTNSEAFVGTILDGETLWGSAVLKPQQNTFSLSNTSGVILAYDLTIYDVGTAPYDWDGVSRDIGTWNSHILVNFPSSGLYTFSYGATQGRYQFLVNDEYVQKTAETNSSVAYYIPAGQHTLTIVQDSGLPNTTWTLNTSAPGAANDSLPFTKNGEGLGGSGNDFDTEWLPINLASATPANFALTLMGDSADTLDVALYAGNADTPFATVTDVYGGETLWWTADLSAGTTRIKLTADAANANPVSYQLDVQARPVAPVSWSGVASGVGNNSEMRFTIVTAGLYDFEFNLGNGRYQFLVDDDAGTSAHIQKTVEVTGTVRYFLPAGNHNLSIVQDTASPRTEWAVAITAANIANDTLPYTKVGGNLGGVDNDFATEWLPVQLNTAVEANFALSLAGDLADGLRAYVYQGQTLVYTSPVVYGGETFWWTTDLTAGSNHIELVADGANASAMDYDLSINAIPYVVSGNPITWSGTSKGTGGQSQVLLSLPVSGTYYVSLNYPSGFANIFIEGVATGQELRAPSGLIEFDAPLPDGDYLFTIQQSAAYTTTTWTATVMLKEAPAPVVTAITPISITNNISATMTISGANFQPGAIVAIQGDTLIDLPGAVWVNNGEIRVTLPAGLAPGTYTVIVTNPDDQEGSLTDALLVILYVPPPDVYFVYLPVVIK